MRALICARFSAGIVCAAPASSVYTQLVSLSRTCGRQAGQRTEASKGGEIERSREREREKDGKRDKKDAGRKRKR